MARPPRPNEFDRINFVVNYFLMGCTPPWLLFCEFAKEPAQDLLFLLIAPDLQDIGQAIFEPKRGRQRQPDRHGRKRRRGIGFPDTSEAIGQRVRGVINPFDAFNISPVRKVVPLLNIYEGINFFCAVVEGVSDVGYEGLLGVLKADPDNCQDLGRLVRTRNEEYFVGTPIIPIDPVEVNIPEVNQGFFATGFGCRHDTSDYQVCFSATVRAWRPAPDRKCSLALGNDSGLIKYQGGVFTFPDETPHTMDVQGGFSAGENCYWGLGERNDFFIVERAYLLAYSTVGLPF